MSGCTGACCAVFYLSTSLADLQERQEQIMDGAMIADMLMPLSPLEAVARASGLGYQAPPIRHDGPPLFTCRHWDEGTRLCKVYEDRPRMCREYPYSGACDHRCDFKITDPVVWLRRWFWSHDTLPLVSRYCAGMREVDRDRRSSRNVRALR